jgi:chromate transporter
VIAGALFILPSLFILMGLSWIYLAFGQVPAVAGVLYGIKPAVTAIVVFVTYRIGSRALKTGCCGRSRRWLSSPSSGWIRHFP